MKIERTLYWIFTGLLGTLIVAASIPDIVRSREAVEIFQHLGYPTYLLPFLGLAKLLGVVAVVGPWFNFLKEWAYAGLTFDLLGALYSHLSVSDGPDRWIFALAGLVLLAASYILFRQQDRSDRGSSLVDMRGVRGVK